MLYNNYFLCMFLNKCCWDCENVCKLSYFTLCLLHMAKCLWWFPFCQNFRNIFGVETYMYECALAEKNRYKTGDYDKNRYKFYIKIILLIDTWHLIFFLNDCSWCELSEYIWCSYGWITRNALFFSLKHNHFTINKERPTDGSTWP